MKFHPHISCSGSWKAPERDLSSVLLDLNENQFLHRFLAGFIANELKPQDLFAYPNYRPLLNQLAQYCKVSTDSLLLTNGADQAIDLVIRLLFSPGDRVVVPSPVFSFYYQMLDVNVKGLLNGVHAVVAGMIERKHGTIINVSSVAGRKTFPNHVAYVGTKFAVHGLSENLREELAPHNVRVTTIAPGAVETELLSHTTDEAIKTGYQAWKQAMGGTVLSADDVASAIAYAYQQPQHVCIREIVLAATRQQP